jgi:hypothetical protein
VLFNICLSLFFVPLIYHTIIVPTIIV